jgi:hypothetical protein
LTSGPRTVIVRSASFRPREKAAGWTSEILRVDIAKEP